MSTSTKDSASQDKLIQSCDFVKSQVFKMDDAVTIAYACMLANQPCLFVGNPGTGKSHTFKLIAQMFGQRDTDWFYQSITAKTSPEKLFGGIIAEEMLKGIETYNLSVGAASYKGIIFDELFKSQHPAMLDALLGFFDENPTIFSGGKNEKPNWEFAFTTTNFEDLEEDLRFDPLWDRMGAKYIVDNLTNHDSKKTLKQAMTLRDTPKKALTLDWTALYKSRDLASAICVDHLIDHFYDKVLQILEKYAYISQRKIHSIFIGKENRPSILQSIAYLQQDTSAQILGFIPYFVWQDKQTFKKMFAETQSVVTLPIIKTYKEIKKDLETLIKSIESGEFGSYEASKQHADMVQEAAAASTSVYSQSDKNAVPPELRDAVISLYKEVPQALSKVLGSVIDEVPF